MASESKILSKLQKAEEKAKQYLAKHRDMKASHGAIPAPATPVIAGVSAAIGGYADGRLGTPDNKHPASIALGAVEWVGAFATAFMGHPTASQALSSAAGGHIAFLSGSAAYDRGAAAKAKG